MFNWNRKSDNSDRERLVKDAEELNKRKYVEAEIKREKEEAKVEKPEEAVQGKRMISVLRDKRK